LSEIGGSFLLAGVESQILQDQNLTILQGRRPWLGIGADRVCGESDGLAQQFGQFFSGWFHAEFGISPVAFGTSQVTHQDQTPASIDHERIEGSAMRMRRSSVTFLIVQGHIEIDPHQDGLSCNLDILNGFFWHRVRSQVEVAAWKPRLQEFCANLARTVPQQVGEFPVPADTVAAMLGLTYQRACCSMTFVVGCHRQTGAGRTDCQGEPAIGDFHLGDFQTFESWFFGQAAADEVERFFP
jgi:hypothetical protein